MTLEDASPFKCYSILQDSMQLGQHRYGITNTRLTLINTARQVKPVYIWTEIEVLKWLRKHTPNAFTAYAENFQKHDITGKI